MVKIERFVGECPECGEDLYLFKSNAKKRFIKCPSCQFSYPVPKRGKIKFTGFYCPLTNIPVVAVIKYIKIPSNTGAWVQGAVKINEYILDKDHSYFYTDRPCYTCPKARSCNIIHELHEEFLG